MCVTGQPATGATPKCCPVTTEIPRARPLTCSEESSLTIHGRHDARFACFGSASRCSLASEDCLILSAASRSWHALTCIATHGVERTANRGKLSDRRGGMRTIHWQKGKFTDTGQMPHICWQTSVRNHPTALPIKLRHPRCAGVSCLICLGTGHEGVTRVTVARSGDAPPSWTIEAGRVDELQAILGSSADGRD